MSKRAKYILALVSGVVVLIASVACFCIWKNGASQESIAFSRLANFMHTEKLQLEGTIKTTQYSADFKTVIIEDSSKTEVTLRLSNHPKGKVQGEIISTQDKTFFKITDVETLLSSLPNDPASRAIKANLARVASEYKNKWIKMNNETEQNNFSNCLLAIRTYALNTSEPEVSFSEHTFFEVGDVKKEANGVTSYQLRLNDKLPAFLADTSGRSIQNFEACTEDNTVLTIFFDEQQNQIVKIDAVHDDTELTISQFRYDDIPDIKSPNSNLTLENVRNLLTNLFVP